jgi:histidine triad (HIT) family protein
MADCIFCKIVKGEIPSYKIYEDKEFLAFLDITQIVDGHTLLIPKKHYRWLWQIENVNGLFAALRKVIKKMQTVSGEEIVMTVTIGDLVPHAHWHLLPKTTGGLEKILSAWRQAMRQLPKEAMEKTKQAFTTVKD